VRIQQTQLAFGIQPDRALLSHTAPAGQSGSAVLASGPSSATSSSSPHSEIPGSLELAAANVRFWHKADIPFALSDVRFWG